MRKILFSAVLILICLQTVFSQETPQLKETAAFRIGINVAPGIAWMKANSNNLTSKGSRFGFLYGLITEYYFTSNYGICSGIDVMYDGGNITDNTNKEFYINDLKYKLQYIEIPITLKMRTKEYGYLSYFAQFGLGGSYNMKAKADNEVTKTGSTPPVNGYPLNEVNKDVTGDNINMFRASFIVGGGFEYSLTGNTKALVAVSFNNGLTNILKGKQNKAINNLLCLKIGIIF
jgi:hypothetical protein